jgi:NADH-quinone oxidoreductase subunit H
MQAWLNWALTNIPPWVIITLVVHGVVLGTVAYLILLERKIASWVQDRIGPNRVGFDFGLIPFLRGMNGFGQPLADGIKFIVKEDYRPAGVDKILFTVAPGIMILTIIISIAVIPWGGTRQAQRTITVPASVTVSTDASGAPSPELQKYLQSQISQGSTIVGTPTNIAGTNQFVVTYQYPFQIASLNIGVLFILAALSLAVYGVVIGGWASNNKYSFLGGLRATANMISYEIPLGLSVLCIVVMYGTLDLGVIVEKQTHYWPATTGFGLPAWNIFTQPLAFVMFLICIHAEANRAPFDLAEAEQELVGGYHTEYSAMRFALFFLAEYAGMITTSAVCVALFFGGWQFPGLDRLVIWILHLCGDHTAFVDPANPAVTNSLILCIVRGICFFTKTVGIIFVFMWVRWSLPRFRFDQLMMLAWRNLIPISLILLLMTTVVVYLRDGESYDHVGGWMALMLLGANCFCGLLIMLGSKLLPPAPATNRKLRVFGSRFNPGPAVSPAVN